MTDARRSIEAALFKPVPGGFVYRAPNPWVFGRADHYLVDEAQKAGILALVTPRRPMLVLALCFGGFLLVAGAAVVALLVFADDYPATVAAALIAAMVPVTVLALHLAARRALRRVQPVLAGASPTNQRITAAEIRRAVNARLSDKQLWRTGIFGAIACLVSATAVAVSIYFRSQDAGTLSDPVLGLLCFNAIMLGLLAASNLHDFRQRTRQAQGAGSAVDPLFGTITGRLISACALGLLVFLAATAVIGVNREFSDQAQGLRYERKGEHDKAIASFSKAIEVEPKNSGAYVDRAKSYSAKGDHDHAVADYSKAIEIAPGGAAVYRKRGDAYRAKGAHDAAIADYSKAIEIEPASATAYYFRGASYNASGNNDAAIADFTKAIEINPRDGYSYYFRGISYPAGKDSERAIADFTKALEINPKDTGSYVSRARRLEAKGDHDQAIADFSKAIEINPNYYYAYVFRGTSLEAKGDRDRAIADFTRAAEIDPKNPVSYRNRAAAYAVTNARDLAIADYRTILDLPAPTDADRKWQDFARRRISQLTSVPPAPAPR
jgi:tetratricopeptide (TPR) repeat protein